jgi:hypothetical protein
VFLLFVCHLDRNILIKTGEKSRKNRTKIRGIYWCNFYGPNSSRTEVKSFSGKNSFSQKRTSKFSALPKTSQCGRSAPHDICEKTLQKRNRFNCLVFQAKLVFFIKLLSDDGGFDPKNMLGRARNERVCLLPDLTTTSH